MFNPSQVKRGLLDAQSFKEGKKDLVRETKDGHESNSRMCLDAREVGREQDAIGVLKPYACWNEWRMEDVAGFRLKLMVGEFWRSLSSIGLHATTFWEQVGAQGELMESTEIQQGHWKLPWENCSIFLIVLELHIASYHLKVSSVKILKLHGPRVLEGPERVQFRLLQPYKSYIITKSTWSMLSTNINFIMHLDTIIFHP